MNKFYIKSNRGGRRSCFFGNWRKENLFKYQYQESVLTGKTYFQAQAVYLWDEYFRNVYNTYTLKRHVRQLSLYEEKIELFRIT